MLVRADAVALPLADNTVDLIVTSPPYFALRSYTDGGEHYDGQIGSEATPQAFIEALWAVTAECRRVLKPSGSMFVNLGDKYASGGRSTYDADAKNGGRGGTRARDGFSPKTLLGLPWRYAIGCIDDLDLILRAEIVWSKPNGLPESVTDRVRRSHEQWFHFTKSPRYYSAVDEVREAYSAPDATRTWGKKPEIRGDHGKADKRLDAADTMNPLGKLPGSVWEVLDCSPWEQLLLSGQVAFCPRCGRDLRAGSGSATRTLPGTVAPSVRTAPSSTSTGSPTNCSSDPSPTGSPSTTSAATEDAATPSTSKPSRAERTSSEAGSRSKRTASTGTASTTPTSTDEVTAASAASVVRVTRSACVCETLDWPPYVPPSVWTVPSEPLRVPEWLGVDHFAAFPQELPRRLILGWSPPGICVECGEGRRPVVDREAATPPPKFDAINRKSTAAVTGGPPSGRDVSYTVTGYACACPTPDAPTRPAVVLDPFGGTGTVAMVARALGRYAVHVDLSADYLRLARWRIYDSGHASKTIERTNREAQGTLL